MSADMGPVTSAVDEYGDQRFAEGVEAGKVSRQGEVDQLRANLDITVARATSAEQNLMALRAEYDAHMASAHPVAPPPDPEPEPEPEPPAAAKTIIGMSAPADKWSERIADVGATGVKARRIFADFTSTGRDQETLIRAAVAAGMMPIVSYKGTPTAANVAAVRTFLSSLGAPVTATWHHEPHGDMTPEAFRNGSQTFLAAKAPNVKVGPILNGWLLDRRLSDFASYTSPQLLDSWDFLGLDTYQNESSLQPANPGVRVTAAVQWLTGQGHGFKPIVVGEYNGFTAQAIRQAGETFLTTPTAWVACVWNAGPTGLGIPLEGERLAAFKATKADSRAQR